MLKCILIRFHDQVTEENFPKMQELRNIICDLMNFNVLKRKTVLEIIQQHPDYYLADETSLNNDLVKKYGQLTVDDRQKSGNFMTRLVNQLKEKSESEGKASDFILHDVAVIKDSSWSSWLDKDEN